MELNCNARYLNLCGQSPSPRTLACAYPVFHFLMKGPIPGIPIVVAEWREEGHCETKPNGDGSTNSSSNTSGSSDGHEDGKTPSIEREHVQAVYDTIAPHW